jgi:hypothetical protein
VVLKRVDLKCFGDQEVLNRGDEKYFSDRMFRTRRGDGRGTRRRNDEKGFSFDVISKMTDEEVFSGRADMRTGGGKLWF